jgi:hypothetical protein
VHRAVEVPSGGRRLRGVLTHAFHEGKTLAKEEVHDARHPLVAEVEHLGVEGQHELRLRETRVLDR